MFEKAQALLILKVEYLLILAKATANATAETNPKSGNLQRGCHRWRFFYFPVHNAASETNFQAAESLSYKKL